MLKTVLILLCLTNLLNIVLPRYAVDSGILRLPIQILNVIILGIILLKSLFFQKAGFHKFLNSIRYFLFYIFLAVAAYIVFSSFDIVIISNILKMILWFSAILYFSKYGNAGLERYKKYMQFFIITFLLAAAKKIFGSADFSAENLERGDIAGLTVILAIPSVFLFFKGKYKNVLLIIAIILVLASVRRTAIIALCAIMPFVFLEFKSKLRPINLMLLTALFILGVVFAWGYFGDAVTQRFSSLIEGDNRYNAEDSYGSGRSIFWMIVLNAWWYSSFFLQLIGHGLSSVRDLLRNEYYDIGHVHNDYIESLYIYGIMGLSLYLNLTYRIWRLRKIIKRKDREKINILYMAFVGFLIIALSSGTFYRVEMIVFSIPIGVMVSGIKNKNKLLSETELDKAPHQRMVEI